MGPAWEVQAIRAAAARAGCSVAELGVRGTPIGARAVGRVNCPDGWAAARLLVALAASDATRPDVRMMAATLRARSRGDAGYADTIHRLIKGRVRFVREKGEVFTGTTYTLAVGYGDCDDHTRIALALAWAGGLPARAAFFSKPGAPGPSHVVAVLCPDGVCRWAETTVDATLGEEPYAAAERLGLLKNRADIAAREVVYMGADDLPPFPEGFPLRSSSDQVRHDALALLALGFLCSDRMSAIASDPSPAQEDFRRAVRHFQFTHGLEPDALIGPITRGALQRAVRSEGIGDLPGLYAPTADPAPQPATLTADIPTEFFTEVKRLAYDLGTQPEYLLEVMNSESDLRPHVGFRQGRHMATGLIGFVGIRDLGFNAIPPAPAGSPQDEKDLANRLNHDEFAKLSHVEQLEFARRFWWHLKGKIESALWLYQYNFVPLSIERGTTPETVIIAKDGTGYNGQEAEFYRVNSQVDANKDGKITVDDLRIFKERKAANGARFAEAKARLASAPEPTGSRPTFVSRIVTSSTGGKLGAVFLLFAAAAASYAAAESLT